MRFTFIKSAFPAAILAALCLIGLSPAVVHAQAKGKIMLSLGENSRYELSPADGYSATVNDDGTVKARVKITLNLLLPPGSPQNETLVDSKDGAYFSPTDADGSKGFLGKELGAGDVNSVSGRVDRVTGRIMDVKPVKEGGNREILFNQLRDHISRRYQLWLVATENGTITAPPPAFPDATFHNDNIVHGGFDGISRLKIEALKPSRAFVFGDQIRNARRARDIALLGAASVKLTPDQEKKLKGVRIVEDPTKAGDDTAKTFPLNSASLRNCGRWYFQKVFITYKKGDKLPHDIPFIRIRVVWCFEADLDAKQKQQFDIVTAEPKKIEEKGATPPAGGGAVAAADADTPSAGAPGAADAKRGQDLPVSTPKPTETGDTPFVGNLSQLFPQGLFGTGTGFRSGPTIDPVVGISVYGVENKPRVVWGADFALTPKRLFANEYENPFKPMDWRRTGILIAGVAGDNAGLLAALTYRLHPLLMAYIGPEYRKGSETTRFSLNFGIAFSLSALVSQPARETPAVPEIVLQNATPASVVLPLNYDQSAVVFVKSDGGLLNAPGEFTVYRNGSDQEKVTFGSNAEEQTLRDAQEKSSTKLTDDQIKAIKADVKAQLPKLYKDYTKDYPAALAALKAAEMNAQTIEADAAKSDSEKKAARKDADAKKVALEAIRKKLNETQSGNAGVLADVKYQIKGDASVFYLTWFQGEISKITYDGHDYPVKSFPFEKGKVYKATLTVSEIEAERKIEFAPFTP